MKVEDPCDEVADSPYVECISNAESVRTVGVVGAGMGASLVLAGFVRYLQGVNRARTYQEWQRGPGSQTAARTVPEQSLASEAGARKGFIIGFGAGPGLTSYRLTAESFGQQFTSDRTSKVGLMTDFKLGYAPSDILALYWMSKVAWGRFESSADDPLITNGFGGMGATYRLGASDSPLFLNGGIGFSTWAAPFDPEAEMSIGLGFVVGSELEFAKHWVLDADLMWGRPSHDAFRYSTLGFKLTVNYLHY